MWREPKNEESPLPVRGTPGGYVDPWAPNPAVAARAEAEETRRQLDADIAAFLAATEAAHDGAIQARAGRPRSKATDSP